MFYPLFLQCHFWTAPYVLFCLYFSLFSLFNFCFVLCFFMFFCVLSFFFWFYRFSLFLCSQILSITKNGFIRSIPTVRGAVALPAGRHAVAVPAHEEAAAMRTAGLGADGGGERACLGPTLELSSGETHIVANVTVRRNFGSEANN